MIKIKSKNLNTFYFDVHGCGIEIYANDNFFNYFKRPFKNFQNNTISNISIKILPYTGKEVLPIRIKGSYAGFKLSVTQIEGREVISIFYNYNLQKEDIGYLAEFTRFLLNWSDKCQIHSSAVTKGKKGFIFAGRGNVGKTTIVIYLMEKGYSIVNDDWVIITEKGEVYSSPQPLRVYDYNLAYNYRLCNKIFGLRAPLMYVYTKARVKFRESIIPLIPNRLLRYALDKLLSRCIKYINHKCVKGQIESVFWLNRSKTKSIEIFPISEREIIDRMIANFKYEFSDFFKQYYQIAPEEGKISYLENIEAHMTRVLQSAFSGVPCFNVLIPYHTSSEKLCETIEKKLQIL
ncbi:MAG: hypothetical protein NC926_10040 [Candidatus Omnitrophica bacterium]|nr:hypothetical protein [Candidatus Omnitrophota bacterium]